MSDGVHGAGGALREPSRPRYESMVVPRGHGAGTAARLEASPELFCPFESGLNPAEQEAHLAGLAWARRHALVRSEGQEAKLERSRIALLEALTLRDASVDVLRLATDWTTLFCLLDDHIELRGLGPLDLSGYFGRLLEALRRGTTEPVDSEFGAMHDLRRRMLDISGEGFVERFAVEVEALFGAFLWEETNRWGGLRPVLDAYRRMRGLTVGLRPQFLLGELSKRVDLAGNESAQRRLRPLEDHAACAVGYANDVWTHAKEAQQGEVHNLVLVVMQARELPVADALRLAAHLHDEEVRQFLACRHALLRDAEPQELAYADMLSAWIRGHMDWARETGRYGSPAEESGMGAQPLPEP